MDMTNSGYLKPVADYASDGIIDDVEARKFWPQFVSSRDEPSEFPIKKAFETANFDCT